MPNVSIETVKLGLAMGLPVTLKFVSELVPEYSDSHQVVKIISHNQEWINVLLSDGREMALRTNGNYYKFLTR